MTWRSSTARSVASSPTSSSWSPPQTPRGSRRTPDSPAPTPGWRRPPPCRAADAARQVALATELDSGHDATAEALDAGLVSPEHAAVIVRATGQLPDRGQRRAASDGRGVPGGEGGPVQPRPAPPPRPPRDRGRRTRPEDRGRPRERAHPQRGASRPGEVLADPARQRRRHHHRPLHHPRPGSGDARQGHRRDDRTPTDARARLQQQTVRSTGGTAAASRSPSSSSTCPPTTCTPRPPPPSVVTIDHTVLAGAMKAAHLDTDQALSAGEARRLACTAGILPAVLGTKSVALDLGRESRLFSESQRRRQRTRTRHLRRHRLRTPLRLVRAPPPTTLGPRRPHRPRRRDPAVLPAPPLDPRHRLQPPDHARRQHPIQQTNLTRDPDGTNPPRARLRITVTSAGTPQAIPARTGLRVPVEASVRKIDLL